MYGCLVWCRCVQMTDINYNEATHSVVYTQDGANVCPGADPMFHWDVRFPERLSRLRLTSDLAWPPHSGGTCLSPLGRRQHRRARADRPGAAGRYRTQPITFDEIAEVDEDGGQAAASDDGATAAAAAAAAAAGATAAGGDAAATKEAGKAASLLSVGFSRSMDGLVTGYIQRAAAAGAVLTGSDKENTPCDVHGAVPTATDDAGAAAGSSDVTSASGAAMMEFQMPAISDISRHRRKRSNRKLRNRNSVPEEDSVMAERGDDASVQ